MYRKHVLGMLILHPARKILLSADIAINRVVYVVCQSDILNYRQVHFNHQIYKYLIIKVISYYKY